MSRTGTWVDGPTTATGLTGHSGGFTTVDQKSTAVWWSPASVNHSSAVPSLPTHHSPVTSEEHQTFWIVANPELVTEQQVNQFFNDQTEQDLRIELVTPPRAPTTTSPSTDLQTALTAVQTSTRTLSIADYSALWMTR